MDDTEKLFTFTLNDGRSVTYAGVKEEIAFNKARMYHGDAVEQRYGSPAQRCTCRKANAESTRQGGWLICQDCAGYIG